MLRYYYFRMRFHKWFQNPNGIKGFAEQSLSWFIKNAVDKSRAMRGKIEMLKDQKSKCRIDLEEIEQHPLLDGDEYFSIRKKIRFFKLMIPTIIIIEVFLNYISTLIFVNGEGPLFTFLRWGIALVLTIAGVLATDALLEAILPNKQKSRIKAKNSDSSENLSNEENNKKRNKIKVIGYSIILIMIEIAIIGVAEQRARDIEGGNSGGLLYFGFILLSMSLPLLAGALRWEMFRNLDAYLNTLKYNKFNKEIQRIDQSIIDLKMKGEFLFKTKVMREWQILSEFRTYKEVYNLKQSPPIFEDLSNHFCNDRESFIEEATKEYYKSTSTIDSASKLDVADKKMDYSVKLIDDLDNGITNN